MDFRKIYLRQVLAMYGTSEVLKKSRGLNLINSLAKENNCELNEIPFRIMGLASEKDVDKLRQDVCENEVLSKYIDVASICSLIEYLVGTGESNKINYFRNTYFGEEATPDSKRAFINDVMEKKLIVAGKVERPIVVGNGTIVAQPELLSKDNVGFLINVLYTLFNMGDFKIALAMNMPNNIDLLQPETWVYEEPEIFATYLVLSSIIGLEDTLKSNMQFAINPEAISGYNCVASHSENDYCILYYYDEQTGKTAETLFSIDNILENLDKGMFEHIGIKKNKIIFNE